MQCHLGSVAPWPRGPMAPVAPWLHGRCLVAVINSHTLASDPSPRASCGSSPKSGGMYCLSSPRHGERRVFGGLGRKGAGSPLQTPPEPRLPQERRSCPTTPAAPSTASSSRRAWSSSARPSWSCACWPLAGSPPAAPAPRPQRGRGRAAPGGGGRGNEPEGPQKCRWWACPSAGPHSNQQLN